MHKSKKISMSRTSPHKIESNNLDRALKLHSSGSIEEAASLYKAIMVKNPVPVAIHMFAVTQYQLGNTNEALEYINKALRYQPNDPTVYNNQGLILKRLGKIGEAERSFKVALELDSKYIDALNNYGNILVERNAIDEAKQIYERAYSIRPSDISVISNLTIAYKRTGELEKGKSLINSFIKEGGTANSQLLCNFGAILIDLGELEDASVALRNAMRLDPNMQQTYLNFANLEVKRENYEKAKYYFEECLSRTPEYAEAHNNLGLLYSTTKEFDLAIAALTNAIKLKPNYYEAINNRGLVYKSKENYEAALEDFSKAILLKPDFVEALNNRGNLYKDLEKFELALEDFNKALKSNPTFFEAYNNRGVVYLRSRRMEKAADDFNKTLAFRPQFLPALLNLGTYYLDTGAMDEAISQFDRALAVQPCSADGKFNKSLALLTKGDLKNGLPLFEYRWSRSSRQEELRVYDKPSLQPGIQGEISVLIYCEQGLGDVIQFSRYVRQLSLRVCRVIFEVPRQLLALLQPLKRNVVLIGKGDDLPEFDYHLPLMSLPFYFLEETDCPLPVDSLILECDQARVKRFRDEVSMSKLKVGLAWQGSKGSMIDIGRSMPLTTLSPLFGVKGTEFYALQKGYGEEQALDFKESIIRFDGLDKDSGAFVDTVGLMKALDLVITTDTSIAHIAGTLGVRTWILLKKSPDWRWGLSGTSTPWYESVTLYRQTEFDNWTELVKRVRRDLEELSSEREGPVKPDSVDGPVVEVSWGELFDKVSILEIKREKITDAHSQNKICTELSILNSEIEKLETGILRSSQSLFEKLRAVNLKLWNVEDKIREFERAKNFNAEFIALARSVYTLNDQRAEYKREINLITRSRLVEVKSYNPY